MIQYSLREFRLRPFGRIIDLFDSSSSTHTENIGLCLQIEPNTNNANVR
uniref:Uncharacterized protein n=1 Tax=Onchocerca volvulus TaxID=6282 RepID=A0A8R1TYT7_ONCVO